MKTKDIIQTLRDLKVDDQLTIPKGSKFTVRARVGEHAEVWTGRGNEAVAIDPEDYKVIEEAAA